jgi:AraC-like DNA-binding protein
MSLVAGGRKLTTVGDLRFDYGAGDYLIASMDLPVTGQISKAAPDDPFVVLTFALRPTVIAGLLLDTESVHRPSGFTGLAVSESTPELVDAVIRMLRLLDDPSDLAALGASVEREIVWRLLAGDQGGVVRQIGLAGSSVALVSRTTKWMQEHLAERISVTELAKMAGMSVSSYHRHFRAATSMSPVQWQKAIRLRVARNLLLSGEATIADVSYTVGYSSASQFSREYRRTFGRPPRADMSRRRDMSESLADAL